MRTTLVDAQAALAFMTTQGVYIEAEVYRIQQPDILYPALIPVDESAPEWIKSIQFTSVERVGQAQWFHHMATDMRLADVGRAQFEQGVEMAGIGYRYTLEEIGQAMMLGFPLSAERAAAAVRAYEEFMDRIAIAGDTDKGWAGLINHPSVSITSVSKTWALSTPDEIIDSINLILTDVYTASNTVEMANTLLLPVAQYSLLATRRVPETTMTILQWISQYNIYTAQTGQPLVIRAVRQLDNAGGGGADRAMAYRRDPSVVKIHVPMRHRFMPVWQTGPLTFDTPGIFRTGGVEVRKPGAIRYADGI